MNPMFYSFLEAAPMPEDAAAAGGGMIMVVQLLSIVLIFVVMYFIMIRPQKKKEKEIQKMRSNVQVGDEVITIGGIVGRVVSMKDDTVVMETGTDRSKIRILRSSIQTNNTIHDDVDV